MREGDKMDIDYVAKLARLNLTKEEKKKFSKQMADILKYIEKLNQLDTKDIQPTAHVLPLKNVWRDDAVRESIDIELIKRIMPEEHEGFFKVPPVIE